MQKVAIVMLIWFPYCEKKIVKSCTKVYSCFKVNAPSHSSAIGKVTIAKIDFELVENPSYSPDLNPTHYQLFLKLKEHLRGERFLQKMMGFVLCTNSPWGWFFFFKRFKNARASMGTMLKNKIFVMFLL